MTNQSQLSFSALRTGKIAVSATSSAPETLDGLPPVNPQQIPPIGGLQTPGTSLSNTFLLHSNPAATKTIYLDFDGQVLPANSAWASGYNSGNAINAPAWSLDADTTTFNDTERTLIQNIWQRVAEDYAPFDVDVTTELRDESYLTRSDTNDQIYGTRALISPISSYFGYYGGLAYVGAFDDVGDYFKPALIFPENLGPNGEKYVAEAISHEVGHNLGLNHDGTFTQGYYSGHGSGATGWAPILGVGYYQELTQWSKGEYPNANNQEDDLAIITTNNGFGYRNDDAGNTAGAANNLGLLGANAGNDTLIDVSQFGIIERNTDQDWFKFTTGNGPINLSIQSAIRTFINNGGNFTTEYLTPPGGSSNLDIWAGIYAADGTTLVAQSNPVDLLSANFTNLFLNAGTYYLAIDGVGKGDLTTGYSDYGSLGQYAINGTIVKPTGNQLTFNLSVNDVSLTEGNSGTKNAIFTVTLSAASSETVTVNYATANDTATAGSDYTASSGIVTFGPGVTSQTISVPVIGDTLSEPNETFFVNLNTPTNASITDGQGIGTIVNDEPIIPAFTINDVSLTEGNSGTKNATFTVNLSQASTQTVSVKYATADGTATTANSDYTAQTGTLTFAAGVTSQTVSVAVKGDTTGETNEQFYLNLNTPTNATIADSQGIGTIQNDDPALIINDIQVQEGPSGTTNNATFTVTLTPSSTNTVSVNYATANGTGTSGKDYTTTKGTFTFNPGETTKTITVPILGDSLVEPSETFFVNLSGNKNATLLDKQGIGTILNYSSSPAQGLVINGTDGPDTLQGTEGDDRIMGLGGSDTLLAGSGTDLLIGVNPNSDTPGLGEIDTLMGGSGADLFVLGDATQVYYDDGNGPNSGYGDYGLVVDFNASEEDLIQLNGFAGNYTFLSSPTGLPSGTAIFRGSELVGVIQNVAPSSIPSNGISYVTFPLANADAATTKQNTAVNISVLANDRDAWAINSFSQGTQGSVTLNNNGTPTNSRDDFLTYTPNTGFSGSDNFSYTISDGNGGTDTATVSVVVQSPFSDVFDSATGKFKLGEALNFTAFALGNQPSGNNFSTNGKTTVNGTIALGSGAKQSFSNPPQVTGDYFYDPLAQSVNPTQVNLVGGSAIQTALTQAETDVGNLAAKAIALTPTQSFGKITAAQTITAASIGANTPSQNVIRIKGIDLASGKNLTLQGDADDVFVIQVFDPLSLAQASLKISGTSQIVLSGGLTPDHVLWYVEGQLNQSGTSTVRGTFLALDPDNKFVDDVSISLNTSLEGQIFANSINLNTGARVTGVAVKTIYGTASADALTGTSGNDGIFGREGDDTLSGLAGNDQIDGGSGNDQLNGNDGNDVLIGGPGNDVLIGGPGSDTFVLASGEGTDTISDFVQGTDVIGLSGGLSFSNLTFSGNNIRFGSQVLATLTGVDTTTLTAGDFLA